MIIKSRKIVRIDIFIDLKVFWPSGPNNFDGFTGSRRDGTIGVDRHNGVGVSSGEIRPCGAKALRTCSTSIASCPLYVEKWSFVLYPNGVNLVMSANVDDAYTRTVSGLEVSFCALAYLRQRV